MAHEAKPLFRPGADVTVQTTGAVTGKTFVAVSAPPDADGLIKAATAGGAVKAFGVAARDIASGDVGAILRGGIVNVTAGGRLAVGDKDEHNNDVLIALDL